MRKLKLLDRNKVLNIPTPEETDTYKPVSYSQIIKKADEVAYGLGFSLKQERFESDISGNKLKMIFQYDDHQSPDGYQLTVLTSHDRSLAVRAAGGVYAYICWNLNMIGDVKLMHRHQTDVQQEVDTFLATCFETHQNDMKLAQLMKEQFSQVIMTKNDIAHLVGEAFVEEKAINSNQLNIIMKELEVPSFKYDTPKNSLWNTYNHFTHAIKGDHPISYLSTQKKVQELFLGYNKKAGNTLIL